MSATVTVRVPGSSANLGSGFDCVGIAVDRWVTLTARRQRSAGKRVQIERRGALAALAGSPEDDLLYRGFERACRAAGRDVPPGLVLEASSDIPIGRGLGSSAAAIVAGAVAARVLCELALDDDALALLCAGVEGHADNVAPSVWGGAILVLQGGRGLLTTPLELDASLVLVFAVPDFTLSTERARAVLPTTLPHRTAVVAAARSAALVEGLASGDPELLAAGLDDVLHVPYRRGLVRGYDEVTAAARRAGAFGATLSGSGSTLVAVAPTAQAPAVQAAMAQAWQSIGVATETFRVTKPVSGYELV